MVGWFKLSMTESRNTCLVHWNLYDIVFKKVKSWNPSILFKSVSCSTQEVSCFDTFLQINSGNPIDMNKLGTEAYLWDKIDCWFKIDWSHHFLVLLKKEGISNNTRLQHPKQKSKTPSVKTQNKHVQDTKEARNTT